MTIKNKIDKFEFGYPKGQLIMLQFIGIPFFSLLFLGCIDSYLNERANIGAPFIGLLFLLFISYVALFRGSKIWVVDQNGIACFRWGKEIGAIQWDNVSALIVRTYSRSLWIMNLKNEGIIKIPSDLPIINRLKEQIEHCSNRRFENL